MNRCILPVALALAGLACGGDEAPAPAPGTPAAQRAPPGTTQPGAQPPGQAAPDSAMQDTLGTRTGLVREVFAYRSAGRDPLQSLLTSADIRPLLEDLRLTTVLYDGRYPARSVAVLRDVSVNKRYDVRVDDELGRLRVVAIRPREVIFSLEEFGVTRQVTLALPKQEGIP
ncbi:MAG: hypothetical protein HYY94_07250 [Gemmatimonadetes bacterium]|nr:hypothetical protein [Gemmatimonadota bacterium]